MAYTNNVPQSNQRIKDTQSPIQQNFVEIQNLITVNHGDFGAADAGKHKFIQFPQQASASSTAAQEMAMYAKNSTLTSQTELYIRRPSNGTEIEFTGALANTNGWTRLPSGILLKWGSQSYTLPQTAGSKTITFPTGATIPAFSVAPYQVLLTMSGSIAGTDSNAYAYFISATTTTFTIGLWPRTGSSFNSTFQVRYLAIGI